MHSASDCPPSGACSRGLPQTVQHWPGLSLDRWVPGFASLAPHDSRVADHQVEGSQWRKADDRERDAGDRGGDLALGAPPPGLRAGEFGSRTSYALAVEGGTLLVDPLVSGDDNPALGALDGLVRGRVWILISKPYHTRSAEPLCRRYRRADARIYGHPDVATRLNDAAGFEAVTGDGEVGGVARFHSIGSPSRSEQPAWPVPTPTPSHWPSPCGP
jgi:hypothetical protein